MMAEMLPRGAGTALRTTSAAANKYRRVYFVRSNCDREPYWFHLHLLGESVLLVNIATSGG